MYFALTGVQFAEIVFEKEGNNFSAYNYYYFLYKEKPVAYFFILGTSLVLTSWARPAENPLWLALLSMA